MQALAARRWLAAAPRRRRKRQASAASAASLQCSSEAWRQLGCGVKCSG